jgi:RHS repeat-associated protein
MTDAAAAVKWRADYEPFGKATVKATSTIENNLRFPGQYFDRETGLHYNYFRDYDPNSGRYIEADPIGLEGGSNLYLYANASPTMYTDPTGEFALNIAGGVLGTISGGVGGYISSGGQLQGAVNGALVGGAVGLINPLGGLIGTFTSGAASSVAGQILGNQQACKDDIFDVDPYLAIAAGIGGSAGNAFGKYLATPRRSAFTYLVNQRMGASPVANSLGTGLLEGLFGGAAEYNPPKKDTSMCGCQK